MKKVFCLIIGGVLILACAAIYVTYLGEKSSSWITIKMWKTPYFNVSTGGLGKEEMVNLMSLQPSIVEKDGVVAYLSAHKCKIGTVECAFDSLSAANILVEAGELERGLKLIEAVRQGFKESESCPISFESSLLLYKIKTFSNMEFLDVISEASAAVDKIKNAGGLIYDLRTQVCEDLAKEKPELFHEYVILISRAMTYAVGRYSVAGAYIQESNKLAY